MFELRQSSSPVNTLTQRVTNTKNSLHVKALLQGKEHQLDAMLEFAGDLRLLLGVESSLYE